MHSSAPRRRRATTPWTIARRKIPIRRCNQLRKRNHRLCHRYHAKRRQIMCTCTPRETRMNPMGLHSPRSIANIDQSLRALHQMAPQKPIVRALKTLLMNWINSACFSYTAHRRILIVWIPPPIRRYLSRYTMLRGISPPHRLRRLPQVC